MEAKLVVNDVEVELGHEELDNISGCLSDHGGKSEILYQLAKSPSSLVRMNVVYNDAMDEKTAERLIRDTSIDVLRGLIQTSQAQKIVTDKDMERLIAMGDAELLCNIAEKVGDFDACDVDALCKKLVAQKDPQIRCRLASNSDTPREFIEELIDDKDVDVARAAENALDELGDVDEEDDD